MQAHDTTHEKLETIDSKLDALIARGPEAIGVGMDKKRKNTPAKHDAIRARHVSS